MNRLKHSARTSNRLLPPSVIVFLTDRSVLLKLGPMTAFRLKFPNRFTATKALVSNHWSIWPTVCTGPIRSGRTVFGMPLIVLVLVTMFTGLPLCACTTAAICQPSTIGFPRNGSS